ncbi:MAG TPA: hypothetical protein VF662_11395 [Allosphingosinicella sp.]
MLLGLALLPAQAPCQLVPPPPTIIHPVRADWRIVETRYRCAGGERRFSVRYDNAGVTFLGGVRKGRRLPAAEVARATAGLRQFDAVFTFNPECSGTFDSIMILGRVGKDRMIAFLVWEDGRVKVSAPQPHNF